MLLSENPFYVLGATTRDDRRRLLELADDFAADQEPGLLASARATLGNPRQRLGAEIRWLPGVSPSRSRALAGQTLSGGLDLDDVRGLLPLAALNAIVSVVERDGDPAGEALVPRLMEATRLAEQVQPEQVLQRINEDRVIAGVPPVESERIVVEELEGWRADVVASLARAMRKLPLDRRIAVLKDLIDGETKDGTCPGPLLLHEVTDVLAVDVAAASNEISGRVLRECEVVRRLQEYGLSEREVLRQIDYLATVLQSWDTIAGPFRVSARARGQEHGESRSLALSIRSLAVDLHNNGGFTTAAERLTRVLERTFADLTLVAATVAEDLSTLAGLREEEKKRELDRREWEASLRYEGSYGWPFKKTVAVSAEGIRHGSAFIPLSDIVATRWGGTRHSVNGIPTGTTYTIVVRGKTSTVRLECRNEAVFIGVSTALRKAVLWRLVVELAQALKSGNQVRFGSLVVQDEGVWLPKPRLFGRPNVKYLPWSAVAISSVGGAFNIGASGDAKFAGKSSYLGDDNTHVLEALVRLLWKQGGDTLSQVVLSGAKAR